MQNAENGKPWSVDDFEKFRPELCQFLKKNVVPCINDKTCNRILIHAPVKSGKREMVEYLSMRDNIPKIIKRKHIFASAFHRIADDSQRREMNNFNIKVFSITNDKNTNACLAHINNLVSKKNEIIIHIDECDFGSGDKQKLSKLYSKIRENLYITCILYTATPEELLFSSDINTNSDIQELSEDIQVSGICFHYEPPKVFCGPKIFLEKNLVTDAIPFFEYIDNSIKLTHQGDYITRRLIYEANKRSGRNILFLRLSYSDIGVTGKPMRDKKAIYQFTSLWQTIKIMIENDFIIYVDKDEKELKNIIGINKIKIPWSEPMFWKGITKDHPVIVIADQTCSRSTELSCHNRILAMHDFRHTVTFSTSSQALERVNHYSTKYEGGFQPIHIYGHLKTIQLSAGKINYSDYFENKWHKKKVNKRIREDGEFYEIKDRSNKLHTEYHSQVSLNEANKILQSLGCYVEVGISSRVKGGIKKKKLFESIFLKCDKESFNSKIREKCRELGSNFKDLRFDNPFIESEKRSGLLDGKYQGYLRGWSIKKYDSDIKDNKGWGAITRPRVTICYDANDDLGVALRYNSGKLINEDTLITHRSMYNVDE